MGKNEKTGELRANSARRGFPVSMILALSPL
jgi:hypothetical protein